MNRISWISLIIIIWPGIILAAEAEGPHGTSPWLDFAGKLVNFLILFGGLTYFLYRPVREWLHTRRLFIEKSLEDVKRGRQKAEKELEVFNRRLADLAAEISRLKKIAEEDGLKERARILELAQEEAARIQRMTRLSVEALKRGAIRELKSHAAILATSLAERRIKERLNPELHRRLIRRSLERIAKLYESPDLS